MRNFETVAGEAKTWIKPELKRLNAGAAENSPGNAEPDGSAGEPTTSQFIS